ncbi:hypothetical protein EAX62_14960 [Tessaracoccus antarcticus]|uniref:Uncharacterized protein n=1 Tax=Tessaracoccus antarcticus TaxID=2479848 RepID=A0A3M0FYQ3_9ACTN|nr:hypothetical protein EAX62_14960 [Tessaracoccus antarcticus]
MYTTPGGQISGGRLWNTTCEKYSSNVVRCRAEIWGTQVQYRGGRYVSTTGWMFNNLTYLPSPQASWAGNNLARNNAGWTSAGRTWRTECDTATTGRGGCRSYVWTQQVGLEDGQYVSRSQWVFNNIVQFSTSAIQPVTRVPLWIIDHSRLDFTGLVPSPLQWGTSMKDLEKLGYFSLEPNEEGNKWMENPSLNRRGIFTWLWDDDETFRETIILEPQIRTVDGAHVGMTFAEVKAIYGDRVHLETKRNGQDQKFYTAVVKKNGYEVVFWNWKTESDRPLVGSDVINGMMARKYSNEREPI